MKKIILSWFSLFCLGLYCPTPCLATDIPQKLSILDSNMNILLANVSSYQSSLKKANEELLKSNLMLVQAEKELELLDGKLERSQAECEAMKKSLENANGLLKTYEQNMKAKINKQRRQKYFYSALAIGAIIYAKNK